MFGRKTWKERYFELAETSLDYYEKSADEGPPKGSISLFEVTTTRRADVPGRKNCFELVTAGRNYAIQAQSDEDRDAWIKGGHLFFLCCSFLIARMAQRSTTTASAVNYSRCSTD